MTDEKKNAISTDSLMIEKRTFAPSNKVVERAHINAAKYTEMYERSINDPEGFWMEQAETLSWFKKPTTVRKYEWDTKNKNIKHTWFEDGEMNITFNCLDRHLETDRKDQPALVWQGEPEDDSKTLTYAQLHKEVCKFANVLIC